MVPPGRSCGDLWRMADPGSGRGELDLIRALLLEAGLERDDEELARLLPWYRLHRKSAARVASIPLGSTEPQVVFDPRWLP